MRKFVKDEKGQALGLVVLLMTVMLGFTALAIDVGLMSYEKTKMQKAADAAALAGAYELPDENNARSQATEYAQSNGYDIIGISFDKDKTKIRIDIDTTAKHFFANVFGRSEDDVKVSATAEKVSSLPSAFTDYAIFSESTTTALSVGKAGNSKVIGTIHTNNTLHLGKHLDVTRVEANSGITQEGSNTIGSFDDHAPIITIPTDFKTALLAQVTSAPLKYSGNKTFSGKVDISQSIYVDGKVTIDSNHLTGKGFIYATGNITISGNNAIIGSKDEPVFIYSEKNITITGNNPTIYGIIYAPNGIIDVQKNNWTLFGSLIGKSFAEDCLKNNFNITAGSGYFGGVPLGDGIVKLIE